MLDAVKDPKRRGQVGGGGGERLLCRACGQSVTSTGEGIEVGGAHEHTFVNPHGHVYRVGCFARAPGVAPTGAPSNEFSWFPGYAWRVALCRGCAGHLGWAFGNGDGFAALIAERIAPED